ncbi:hypothetical protein V6N13_014406 [Hibiscus sabdariffa]|uniref:Uncharacterized protein n=1 Tax=Hibiscus sabdariffa TaxID=183260 RepID=A0ABR2RVX2_9ROSI
MEEFRPSPYQVYGDGGGGRRLEIIDDGVLKCANGTTCYGLAYPPSPPFNHKCVVSMKKKKNSDFSIERWSEPNIKRKMRITGYKMYAMEGKLKNTLKKAHKWIKKKYHGIVHGY